MKRRWWKRSKRPPVPVDPAIAAGENPAEDIGTPYPNEVQAFYYERLGWCGCGNPDGALEFMRDVLQVMKTRSDANRAGGPSVPYEKSAWKAGADQLDAMLPEMVGLSYLYMLDALDLTEHGGSVGGSWLTADGEAVLKMLVDAGDLDIAMRSEFE